MTPFLRSSKIIVEVLNKIHREIKHHFYITVKIWIVLGPIKILYSNNWISRNFICADKMGKWTHVTIYYKRHTFDRAFKASH